MSCTHTLRGPHPNKLCVLPPLCATWQVPYLEDPSRQVAMWESAQILQYLEETYQKQKAA